jgi:hypothetical protein
MIFGWRVSNISISSELRRAAGNPQRSVARDSFRIRGVLGLGHILMDSMETCSSSEDGSAPFGNFLFCNEIRWCLPFCNFGIADALSIGVGQLKRGG